MVFNPPACPNCKSPLEAVDEAIYDSYVFNPDTGSYDILPQRADCDLRCSKCTQILPLEVFPEGVCNYQADKDPCKSCRHAAQYPENCEGCEYYEPIKRAHEEIQRLARADRSIEKDAEEVTS